MRWPPSSPDLNLIENLWSFLMMMILDEGGKQYNSKANLWEAIKTTTSKIKLTQVKIKRNQWILIGLLAVIKKKITKWKYKNSKTYPMHLLFILLLVLINFCWFFPFDWSEMWLFDFFSSNKFRRQFLRMYQITFLTSTKYIGSTENFKSGFWLFKIRQFFSNEIWIIEIYVICLIIYIYIYIIKEFWEHRSLWLLPTTRPNLPSLFASSLDGT